MDFKNKFHENEKALIVKNMSDDDSSEVVIVASTSSANPGKITAEDTETRPIMELLQRLINNDSNQNTVLTNAQINSILQQEFDIDTTTLHELEADIYLNVVKRFLKDWPKWDEFNQEINMLRKKHAYKSIKKTLEANYIDMKEFLKIHLDATKPLAQEEVKKIIKKKGKLKKKVDNSDITLEVYCTRNQLNELVLSQPISDDVTNTLFNLTEFKPTSVTVNNMPIESILNWFGVSVTINSHSFYYQRTVEHQLKHILVNTKNGPRNLKRELNSQIQIKEQNQGSTTLHKEKVFKLFQRLLLFDAFKKNCQLLILRPLTDIVESDLQKMDTLKCSATYRQYSNKYPYYRKLKKDVEGAPSASYDLYVEETLSPMHSFQFEKSRTVKPYHYLKNKPLFMMECMECKLKFSGDAMYTFMREHFEVYHSNEPDWICTNCEKSFTMIELARNKWQHDCM